MSAPVRGSRGAARAGLGCLLLLLSGPFARVRSEAVGVSCHGNLSGKVLDGWGRASAGAEVRLRGSLADLSVVVDADGDFLLSGLPVPCQGDSATFAFSRDPADTLRIWIPPGALMAPRILVQGNLPMVIGQPWDGPVETFSVYIEDGSPIRSAARASRAMTGDGPPWSVLATREGLVGYTTANGHKILENDRFVALPSRRALSADDSDPDRFVEVRRGEFSTVVPVFDVGPWNVDDDWWNGDFRASFGDLPRGLPQAMAAFRDGYNGGKDGSGRLVRNGAGIDLADGVFREDLKLTDNSEIEVRLLWVLEAVPGDPVAARHWANMRAAAGGSFLRRIECGETGIVVDRADSATVGGRWYAYRKVAWSAGDTGWVIEDVLSRDLGRDACASGVRTARRTPGPGMRAVGDRLRIDATRDGSGWMERWNGAGRLLERSRIRWNAGENLYPMPPAVGVEVLHLRSDDFRQVVRRAP